MNDDHPEESKDAHAQRQRRLRYRSRSASKPTGFPMDDASPRGDHRSLTVTSLERQARRTRLAIHLSNGASLSLTPDVAARFRLVAGTAVTVDRLEEINRSQAREDAMTAALRLVAFRPRREKELRQALTR